MTKELISRFYSSDVEVKRAAVYRALFDRRHDLLPELKKAITYEHNEQMAVFMMQVVMTLEAFPRDFSTERRILEILQKNNGAGELQPSMWKYLCGYGTSEMLIATLGAMGDAIPPDALDFIDTCINHPDPEVRAMACEKAIKSGRPTHFAYVLTLITDPDPMVAETAFTVIHSMPVNELAIVLDYALGSPDEWVLENVAPFLPNIVNNGLRAVISKVQYHKHPLVSRKAREALKALDAIPYQTKKEKEKAAEEKAEKDAEKAAKAGETAENKGQSEEKGLSFKEQMELKRVQKIEEEKRRKDEDEKLAAELAGVKAEEIASFADELAGFEEIATGKPKEELKDGLPTNEEAFLQNQNFETETAMLDAVDAGTVSDEEILSAKSATLENENGGPGESSSVISTEIDLEAAQKSISEKSGAGAGDPDSATSSVAADPVMVEALVAEPVALSVATAASAAQDQEPGRVLSAQNGAGKTSVSDGRAMNPVTEADKTVSVKSPVPSQVQQTSGSGIVRAAQPAGEAVIQKGPQRTLTGQTASEDGKPVSSPAKANASTGAVSARPGVAVPGPAREIITRYPSFISDPFAMLFQPAKPEVQLKYINLVADNLIAFLNLCFLQSCLFYAQESDVLARSIRECLKGSLVGPTALRSLHNFALSMKAARGSPVFFTFSLAGIFSESSDTNPLMMLRELKEFLREPVEPLAESVPQAIEGLTDILRGVKSILNNLIVMKTPQGAKEPFADLSGPEARALAADKRPTLDLPVGEVVLLSRDGGEAFGLFPFFKYAKKKLCFAKPDAKELAVFYERLEIPAD
mgnify:CR=1 FL=1